MPSMFACPKDLLPFLPEVPNIRGGHVKTVHQVIDGQVVALVKGVIVKDPPISFRDQRCGFLVTVFCLAADFRDRGMIVFPALGLRPFHALL